MLSVTMRNTGLVPAQQQCASAAPVAVRQSAKKARCACGGSGWCGRAGGAERGAAPDETLGSSEVENEESAMISASTWPTRRSRRVISAWSESTPRSSWPTFSQRDFLPRRGRLAFRRYATADVKPVEREGPRSSRGSSPGGARGFSSRVTSALTRGDLMSPGSQAKARARHRLESPGYPSQGTRIEDSGSGG